MIGIKLALLVMGAFALFTHCVDVPSDGHAPAPLAPAPIAQISGALSDAPALVARYVVLEGPGAIAHATAGSEARARLDEGARKRVQARAAELRAQHAALRPRLEALGATIIEDVVLVGNAFQIVVDARALPAITKLPGVARLGTPTVLEPALHLALPLVGVPDVWSSGSGYHGEGMRIGIIDTGIDYTHADFGGAGDPAVFTANDPTVIEPGSFPTAKVIGGVDLVGNDYDGSGFYGSLIPVPDEDPLDCAGHGTPVSSIAAGVGSLLDGAGPYEGPWDASLDPAAFSVYPGAAPAASIFIIKVFGCVGGGGLIMSATELAVDPDGDDDPVDRLDVVNLSLGTSYAITEGVESSAFAALRDAGSLVVAADGNDGRVQFSLGFPASEPSVVAVGATLREAEASQYDALEVIAPEAVAGIYPFIQPRENPEPAMPEIEAVAVVAEPVLGCSALDNGAALSGKVAILRRGTCGFAVKAQNAADAGAVAAIIIDNTFSDFPPGNGAAHAIPLVMMRLRDGDALIAAAPITIAFHPGAISDIVTGPDYAAPISSAGPTADGLLLKPDLAAPGAFIAHAAVGTGWDAGLGSGTSFASPIVAGAAALLRQARPTLGPTALKALLTSTARPVMNAQAQPFPTTVVGSGRLQIDDTLDAEITARAEGTSGQIGVSFGAVLASKTVTVTREVMVDNLGADAATLTLSLEPGVEWPGMTVSLLAETVEVAPGGTATFTLALVVDPDALPEAPAYHPFQITNFVVNFDGRSIDAPNVFTTAVSGRVVLTPSGGGTPAVVAYYGSARAAAERAVDAISGCVAADSGALEMSLKGAPASHDNATSVLELGTFATSAADLVGLEAIGDIVAVGAFADPASERTFFGVATAADWPSPSLGAVSVVAIEIDTDGDAIADFMVTAESITRNESAPDDPLAIVFGDAPFARVVDLASGDTGATLQPLNGVFAAYPGGVFFDKAARETELYYNSVVVFPVALDEIGLDGDDAALSYRAISFTSRIPMMFGQPLPEPLDTSDWVAFDAAAPKIALPDCIEGTPLCAGDYDSIAIDLPQGAAERPTILVFHHTNVPGARYESRDLAAVGQAPSDLTISGGSDGTFTPSQPAVTEFTVTNAGDPRRDGVTVTVGGGAALTSTVGTCDGDTCALGPLAGGAVATITATANPNAGNPILDLVATVSSDPACESDTSNDSATVRFTLVSDVAEPPVESGPEAAETEPVVETAAETVAEAESAKASDSGCGCGAGARPDLGAVFAGLALAFLALRRKRLQLARRYLDRGRST